MNIEVESSKKRPRLHDERVEDDGEVGSNRPVKSRREDDDDLITRQALSIVLQHWLIPQIGWRIEAFYEKLPALRHSVVESIALFTSHRSNTTIPPPTDVHHNLINKWHYFDAELFNSQYQALRSVDREAILRDAKVELVRALL